MIGRIAAPVRRHVLGPVAVLLLRRGVGPDAVTVVGTAGVVVASLTLVASGALVAGSIVVAVLALADAIDGAMARAAGRSSAWGAFLDSTLDRVGDAAVLAALAVWFHAEGDTRGLVLAVSCLAAAPLVPYARARGEALGAASPDGVAGRADRLAVVLAAMLATGLGAPGWVLHGALGLLVVAIAVTVAQRMAAVRRQLTPAGMPQRAGR